MDGLQPPYKILKKDLLEMKLRQQSSAHLGRSLQQHGGGGGGLLVCFCACLSHICQPLDSSCRVLWAQLQTHSHPEPNIHNESSLSLWLWLPLESKRAIGRIKICVSTASPPFCIHLHWSGRQQLTKMFQCRVYFLLNGPLDW